MKTILFSLLLLYVGALKSYCQIYKVDFDHVIVHYGHSDSLSFNYALNSNRLAVYSSEKESATMILNLNDSTFSIIEEWEKDRVMKILKVDPNPIALVDVLVENSITTGGIIPTHIQIRHIHKDRHYFFNR